MEAGSSSYRLEDYLEMGFERKMVEKAMEKYGSNEAGDANPVLDELLRMYKQAIGNGVCECSTSACPPQVDNKDHGDDILEDTDDEEDSTAQDLLNELAQLDEKLESIVVMGFPEDEAKMAILRCGPDAEVSILIDSIHASQAAGRYLEGNFSNHEDNSNEGRKKGRSMGGNKKKRKQMIGFNFPTESHISGDRPSAIHALDIGPPYFYYENIARAPKGVWATMSRFLYDIEPEFVDSEFICAATRKRGYIHNLPIQNRSPLTPLPPKTIFEAFPHVKEWWPSWDSRTKLNCLWTSVTSSATLQQIRLALVNSEDPPPKSVQDFVMKECRKGNLLWIGKNRVTPLEPIDMERLLAFPEHHTRGIGGTRQRYQSLGNSFQVDTVAYHLSVLRDMFPNGMNVLSLFSGIGGAEIALHKLGIRMKNVVSVEKSKVNRAILRTWWEENEIGTLIDDIDDVQELTTKKIEEYVAKFGGFDLVIGGSPCNNLAGSNRYHRNGLEGEHSSLFYVYVRILEDVKSAMRRLSITSNAI